MHEFAGDLWWVVKVIAIIAVVVVGVGFLYTVLDPDLGIPAEDAEYEEASTPNLYELTRQTAENTRHIFWLIVVCFAAWSFRSYKTGK